MDINRIWHLTDYTFFLNAYGMFTKRDNVTYLKSNLNKFQSLIIQGSHPFSFIPETSLWELLECKAGEG